LNKKGNYMKLKFLFSLAAALVILSLSVPAALAQTGSQIPLPGSAIPQFIDPLPSLHTIIDTGSQIELRMTEVRTNVMPSGFVPATGTYNGTWVWTYLDAATQFNTDGITPNPAAIPSYIGPVIVAERGSPTSIKYVNNLGDTSTSNVLAYTQSTDQTLHWANPDNLPMGDPDRMLHYSGSIPAVPHLHGGEVPPVIDGGPDQWFTSDGTKHGLAYYTGTSGGGNSVVFNYPNSQEAASIWFHDHTLGATRLNVYAGLAGAYILTDDPLVNPLPANLQGPADIVPLVIQDRMFDTNGQLYMPATGINPTDHPFWIPEFVGDTIVVNGKVWPFKEVEQKRYRFLFLNGSNARPYEMFLTDPVTKLPGPPMWVIGTDGGYLDTPVKIDPALGQKLVLMPGERYDVIIDFADTTNNPTPSGTYILRNTARTPYPKGTSPNGQTVGRILQFRLIPATTADTSYDPASGATLRINNPIVRLVDPVAGTLAPGVVVQKTRELTLNEEMGPGGPLEVLVNNSKWGGMRINTVTGLLEPIPGSTPDAFGNYLTEFPNEGDVEIWEIVNLTADAHPIHLHLVQFQIMNRQNFNTNKFNKAYNALFPASVQIDPMTGLPYTGGVFIGGFGPPLSYDAAANALSGGKYGGNPDVTPYLQGPAKPPAPNEAGWKDTAIMYPGQVTRIAVRWAPTELGIGLEHWQYSFSFDPNALGGDYVWHCHIIDHEDNEMMRPDQVVPNPDVTTRYYVQGIDY
jgi:spore coat protein A